MFKRRSLVEKMTVDGHFIFASGRHATTKLDYERLGKRDQKRAAKYITNLVLDEYADFDAIVGVADGANLLAMRVAKRVARARKQAITFKPTIKALNTEAGFMLSGGNIHAADKRWLIIDDIFTKGTNTSRVANVLHRFGGTVVGVAVLANRSCEQQHSIPYPTVPQVGSVAMQTLRLGAEIPVVSVYDAPMIDFESSLCEWAPDCPQKYIGTREDWLDKVA